MRRNDAGGLAVRHRRASQLSNTIAIRGSLFTPDILTDSIRDLDDWKTLAEDDSDRFREAVEEIFSRFPISQRPNESQTEDDLIWPILEALGWTAWLRQQNLSPRGREDVPDGILFESDETKDRANGYPEETWVPLYEGKMVQAFDHRAASIAVNPANVHRPARPVPASLEQHRDPNWLPDPQHWVLESETSFPEAPWLLSFKDVTAPTNVRSMIAALIPRSGAGNTLPVLSLEDASRPSAALLLANLNSIPFDYVARQKIQGQHLNWYIIEQLPVVPPERYDAVRFGPKSAAEIVREAVLEVTYTAHDMAAFARDMGYVDAAGEVLPPFRWDEDRRLQLRAKLDALYFHLYGITDRDDIRYVYSTFPIVKRQETQASGSYRSRELCLAWVNALRAGNPDAEIIV